MAQERIVAQEFHYEDRTEGSLRPRFLYEYIGQDKVREKLGIFLEAAKGRREALDHVLLSGPPGLGKTTLANIIANELGATIKTTSGPAIERAGDLASLLTNLSEHDVLFIDEIHRINRTVEEILYSAMEDFALDIMIGKGPSAKSLRLDLAPFTLIGATTRAGQLTKPLRDRFGVPLVLEPYDPLALGKILRRSAKILGVEIEDDAVREIASRSRGTPRIANRLLRRVRDIAEVRANGVITNQVAKEALKILEIDPLGLDAVDRRILEVMAVMFSGRPVGIEAIAAAIGEDRGTIEDVYEPFLLQIGFIQRTPRGRMITKRACSHFGFTFKEIES